MVRFFFVGLLSVVAVFMALDLPALHYRDRRLLFGHLTFPPLHLHPP